MMRGAVPGIRYPDIDEKALSLLIFIKWRRRRKRRVYVMRLQAHQRPTPRAVQSSALQCRQFQSQRRRFRQREHLSALRLPSLNYGALSIQPLQRHCQRLRHLFSHRRRHRRRHRHRHRHRQ